MNAESIIEKFIEQAKKNRFIEGELDKLKENIKKISDFLEKNEKQLKNATPDVSGFIIDFYKAVSERIKDIYIKDGCLYVGESNLGEVCGKDGLNGKEGKDGLPGKDGKNGLDGLPGKDGKDGPAGKDGKNGKDGISPEITVDDKNIYVNKKVLIPLEKLKGKDGKDGKSVNNYRTLYEMAQEYGFSESEEKFISIIEKLNKLEIDNKPQKDSENLITSGALYSSFEYKLIGETEITDEDITQAGETGIAGITVELNSTLGNYRDVIISIYIPNNTLNTDSGYAQLITGINQNALLSTNNAILSSQSKNYAPIFHNYTNRITIKTEFDTNKTPFYVQYMTTGFGTNVYPYNMYAVGKPTDSKSLREHKYIHFNDRNKNYLFPSGTTMKVYAR